MEGAIATRALAKTLAFQFGGGEMLVTVDDEPMKSVKGEVSRVRALLEKHGVLPKVYRNGNDNTNGESNGSRLLENWSNNGAAEARSAEDIETSFL